MYSITLLSVLLATGHTWAAAIQKKSPLELLGRSLASHEALLYGDDGRVEVWNKTDIAAMNFDIAAPKVDKRSETPLEKRFSKNTIIVPNADTKFKGWDVVMSQVVQSPANSKATISIMSGVMIADAISVGETATFTLVKDYLTAATTLTYTHTYTTQQTTTNTFQVDEGKYGVIVSNPITLRKSGTVFEGVIGSEGTLTTYQADSFSSQSYEDMEWVAGLVSVCQSDTYPIPACVGDGTHE